MRKTIGTNPLDAVVPNLPSHGNGTQNGVSSRSKNINDSSVSDSQVGDAPNSNKKLRLTVHVTPPLINRCKNAVYWTPGLTLADLGERALEALVKELEKENGGPFKQRPEELKGGRPIR